ncbi:outer membrane beta-barrel protein [Dysgonomonas alginatilytica]|uniref:Outer membrane beta-barrel protein n=1 Tax=Dysgonomonas alginatilytica TaxID=1605892 RepID=A0A2V3PTY7_9BACT|nr:TonB-dependent receptor [Dysgonomonas alginatilytica]PXV69083.1 outer membrane beta-barrel protein [Dysgonomonas alginatilytica]
MRYTLPILTILATITSTLSAQQIKISGKIIDAVESTPIGFATVSLLKQDSTFIKGVTSNDDGLFAIPQVAKDTHLLSVSFLGYETQVIELSKSEKDITVSDIALHPASIALNDITVTANSIIHKIDKDVILPTAAQLKSSISGISLLQNLMLPRVIIDQVNNVIKTSDGSEIQLRINGVIVSYSEILALIPQDIIRVEFHDNPGLRYGDVAAVLDFITRRKSSGGSINAELMNNPFVGFGNNSFNAKVNHRKSEFSFNSNEWDRDLDFTRNSRQSFIFPDKEIHRNRVGEAIPFKTRGINNNLNYSLQESGKYFFNAALRQFYRNTPNGFDDEKSTYYTGDSEPVNVYIHSAYRTNAPMLDLYFQRDLKNQQLIIVNVIGKYTYSKTEYKFQESRNDVLYTDINNLTKSDRYALVAEGIYEKTFGTGSKLSTGLKQTQTYTESTYSGSSEAQVNVNQSETYLYAEYQLKKGKFNTSLGVGATRMYYSVQGSKTEKYLFRPTLRMTYTINDAAYIKYNGIVYNRVPSEGDLNNVEQEIDSLQIRRGNPNLRPFMTYQNTLWGGYKKGIFDFNLWMRYRYINANIANDIFFEDGKFINQNNNQRAFHNLIGELRIQVQPIKDHLTFSFTPGIARFINKGNNYLHTYTRWYYNSDMTANYKKWIFNAFLANSFHYFEGETLYLNESWQNVSLGYKTDRFSISAGVINPFTKEWKSGSRVFSALVPMSSQVTSTSISKMPYLKLSYNVNFGRQYKSADKKIDNSDI